MKEDNEKKISMTNDNCNKRNAHVWRPLKWAMQYLSI